MTTTQTSTTRPTTAQPTPTRPTPTTLPALDVQLDRLLALGLADLAGVPEAELRSTVAAVVGDEGIGASDVPGADDPLLLAIHPDLVPARALAPLLERAGRPGFVVVDWTDLEDFRTVPDVELPDRALYVVRGADRGDDLRGASPEEALAELTGRGRAPLTLHEGIGWLMQDPSRLEPNHCFMCLATRKPRPRGAFDARTPALWISGGTGRDGVERRGAPKVGWCWWRNRHTWLGFASATGRG